MGEKFEMIAKTLQGLEDVLAEEIIAIGGEEVEQGKRMVSFIGDKKLMYKANLTLRTALRILKPIATFNASNTDEVYETMKKIQWEDYLQPDQTFTIDTVIFSDDFRHSKFVTYRAKDAIADYFQEKYEKRPSVRLTNADLALNLHIAGNTCTLSLDSSGESLHKRGYRVEQTEAPLNEVLAAGMILKTGWRGEKNFIDPMCGSGTLLIEAAMIATNTPPGVYRQGFAFEKWKDYDEDLFDQLYNDDSNEKNFDFKIYGSDISPRAIKIAQENLKSAGLSKYVDLKTMPFQQYELAPENAVLVMNPPYGERISSNDILSLYEMIGRTLKHVFKGYDAWILSYRDECFEKIGLKPSEKIDLMNGGLECQYRKYEIFSGKLKEFKSEGGEFTKHEEKEFVSDNTQKRALRKARFTEGDDAKPYKKRDAGRGKFTSSERGERKSSDFGRKRDFKKEGDKFESKGERKSFDRDKKPFDRDRKPFDKDRKPFDREKRSFDKDRKPFDRDRKPRQERDSFRKDSDFSREDRPQRRDYSESGNFRRNAEGKLELRTDGEFKPRGERTFNPDRKMRIPGKDEAQSDGRSNDSQKE
ncbi:MAG: THUMP domain-containing protein [Bacteroidales bacterium]|nr:THUMP domain-containing protein [Bacteroidales bacterium]